MKGTFMLRSTCLALLMFAGIASADVQNGVVRYQGQNIPGATVTAECGKDTDKITTVTDDAGRFEMGGLPSTSCKYTVLLFGFQPLQKDATASATPLTFDLNMQQGTASIPVAPSAAPTVTAATPPPAAATPATPAPAPSQASAPDLGQRPSLTGGNGPGGGRGGQGGGRGGQNAGGRGGQGGRGGGFQALSLTQNGDSTASDAPASLLGGDNGGSGTGASDAFTVNGTLSQGVQAQAGDGMGMGGPGGFGFGPGGPGGPGGEFGGPGGPGGGFGGPGGGGRGGDGGGRGGPGGGGPQGFAGGGGPGGFGGPGGPGGFGGGRGGPGGPGGPGGRGGGRGPNGVTSFGNRAGRGRGPQWQASITYNFANSALNARPYSFATQTTTPVKAATANNQLGFTLGGPIMIPHTKLNLKNSRWNLNVQGSRNRVGVDDISSVPSVAMRSGDFSSLIGTTTIVDPGSGTAFAGNVIPQSRLSPTALALLNYIPQATGTGLRNNYQYIATDPNNNTNVNLQVSDPITTKDRININLSRQSRNSIQTQAFGFNDPQNGWGGNLSLSYSRTLNATTVNTFTIAGNRNVTNNLSFFSNGTNVAGELGIQGVLAQPSTYGPPTLSFQNFSSLNDGTPSTNHSTQVSLTDSVAKTKGKHNMQIGFTGTKRFTNSLTASNARGTFSFSSVNADGTGYDFADFLLGLPNGASANQYLNGDDVFYYRQNNVAAYFNDDYRLSTNFTLNGGLRWEYYSPQTEKYNHMANVTYAANGLSASLVTPGENDINSGQLTPNGLIHGDWKMYEPQIGFAYKPWSKKAIVFRGGYGIRYNGSAFQTEAARLSAQPPFVKTINLTSTTTPNLTLLTGLNALASGEISNTFSIAPNYVPARAQQWNAIAQYTFLRSYVFQLTYSGTKGDNLDVLLGPNRGTPILGSKTGTPSPISNMVSTIQLDESIGNSIFHSGQAQITRRFARGLSGGLTYTLQKSIDDSSTLGGGVVQIENNLLAERGLSNGIPHQTVSVNFNYQTLAGNQKSEFYWNIIRGWQLFGGYNLTSGSPFTATVTGDPSGTGINGARAEATGLPVEDGSGYFNPAAFAVPATGTYGNAGRNTIPGIWNFSMNASAMRSFRIGERRRLALTFSTQNPLNHPSITGIYTVIGSQTQLPGTPTSAGNMRTVTAQARFTF